MSPEGDHDPAEVSGQRLQQFARRFLDEWADRPLDADKLVEFAASAVPHAIGTGLTVVRRDGRPATLAASSELAARVDALEYEAGEGPCLDAITDDDINVANDLASDPRWPTFSARAVRETPVRSMIGARVFLGADERGALNFYAVEPGAFDDLDIGVTAMMSTLCSVVLQHDAERTRASHLQVALESSRQIGMAMGILMSSRLLTADQAFEELRRTSQQLGRKLRDVAQDVTESGQLPQRRSP